ncbi:beta-ketoacyl synthase chain length factor [Acidovorax sp. Be4]|uniref:Beta-ketoacyl synthase chain length factor n=1 Tax=Acidovorax bellezanensis TaxID=2976702 RepID=A0ABT2PSU5_9BURK|nr:beta-ketoacyl synthase chain length factor [Acidovorax sp. Be4]MCT9812956.1 beta-ketoacyl synthase chain length factor [Acidovorax sp. Be4]
MPQSFVIHSWAAVASGLSSSDQWLAWARAPFLPVGLVNDVALVDFPAMSRRRLALLGKMAVSVADQVLAGLPDSALDLPVVWASRYGDAQRSLELLREQASAAPLSPTSFALSVHNAIGAQHSIARRMRGNALCVAAAGATVEAGLLECMGLLAEGAQRALLVCYDGPLPADYAHFHDEPACAYAWAWLLGAVPAEGASRVMRLEHLPAGPAANDASARRLPHGLEVLQWALAPGQGGENGRWRWSHANA